MSKSHYQKVTKYNYFSQTDPSMIFLTTFMLGNIFSEKISTHNPNFKDIVRASYLEVRHIITKNIFL